MTDEEYRLFAQAIRHVSEAHKSSSGVEKQVHIKRGLNALRELEQEHVANMN